MVMIAYQLDNLIGLEFVRYGVITAFIVNELISIIENAGLMGVAIPTPLIDAIDILKKKKGKYDGK